VRAKRAQDDTASMSLFSDCLKEKVETKKTLRRKSAKR